MALTRSRLHGDAMPVADGAAFKIGASADVQTVNFTNASSTATGAAIDADEVLILATQDVWVIEGAAPTAVAGSGKVVPAGFSAWFITRRNKLAFISVAAASGSAYVMPVG